MSAVPAVVLILGAGANETDSTAGQLNVPADLSDPKAVVDVFTTVKAKLGIPSVVIYNAAAATRSDPTDPLSLPLADFTHDLSVNTTSPFLAAQQAAQGFAQLPDSMSRTFIYTGNILNTTIMPPLMDLGVGKSATAHVIQVAAAAYKDCVFKFYYADERKADGSAAFSIDGDAHARLFTDLADGKTQGPWQQTFVKGVGYRHF